MVRYIVGFFAALFAATLAQAASVAPPPPPVEDYGKLPGIGSVSLSPSGQRYAFIALIEGKRRLVVATTSNEVLGVNDITGLKTHGLEWAGDDHLLLHYSATVNLGVDFTLAKDELSGVIVLDLKHHKSFPVFGDHSQERVANVVVGSFGTAEIAGHWYGYFGAYSYEGDHGARSLKLGSDDQLYPDLYKVDLDTGEMSLAATGDDLVHSWLVGPNGEVAARLLYNEKSGDWRLMPSKWGGKAIASGRSLTRDIDLEGFGRTPGTVLLQTSEGDHHVLEELPLAGGAPTATFNEDELGERLFDPSTRLWIGVTDQEQKTSNLFSPPAQAKLKGALKAFPGYSAVLTDYSSDFNRMIVFTDGGDDSGTYWIVDIATHAANELGSPYPTVQRANVGPTSTVEYKATDGLALQGVLTLPPGREAKILPLVVMPHGGPEGHDSIGFDYWAQAFASRGYAVFQPNFRGSDGFGKSFRDAGLGQWGRKMQTDISDGVAELVRRGLADPKRTCIAGWSYGGYAALAGVTVQQGLYRCAVSMAGVADLPRMLAYEGQATGGISSTTRYWREFMGVKTAFAGELKDISPARIAERADAPILLIHGKDDTVVSIEQSQAMERALKRAGKPVEFITLPGADHWLLEEDARIAMVKASVDFIMKHNPPDPTPATVAAAR